MKNEPRVLAIDDDELLLGFLKSALTEFGVEVVISQSAKEGIRIYQESQFDLIFVDYMMPEMNGVEVLRQIMASDPNAFCIMMTGNASIESAVEAMKLGAVDYLTKPLDLDHLEIVLKKTLQHKSQTEKLRLLEAQVTQLGSYEGLIGVTPLLWTMLDFLRNASAPSIFHS
jgi:DNA-binding NtrC family response regulator